MPPQATAPAPARASGAQAGPATPNLDAVLQQPVAKNSRALSNLYDREDMIAKLEKLLPPAMKGQASRLYRRAILTINRARPGTYDKVTGMSFTRCVLEAAELGLAIDGRLAHAVPFGTDATLIVDYKGMIAVARRTGLIADAYARLVWPDDHFRVWEEDGENRILYEPALTARQGEPLGAFAVVKFPGGTWRYEWMCQADINAIRNRSKAYKSGGMSPWKTDPGEMARKTVLRRVLKTYIDDPGFNRLLDLEDREYEEQPLPPLVQRASELPPAPPRSHRSPDPEEAEIEDFGRLSAEELSQEPPPEAQQQQDADGLIDDLGELVKQAETQQQAAAVRQKIDDAEGTIGHLAAESLRAALAAKARPRK
jgi:phage RecT family recombinase